MRFKLFIFASLLKIPHSLIAYFPLPSRNLLLPFLELFRVPVKYLVRLNQLCDVLNLYYFFSAFRNRNTTSPEKTLSFAVSRFAASIVTQWKKKFRYKIFKIENLLSRFRVIYTYLEGKLET